MRPGLANLSLAAALAPLIIAGTLLAPVNLVAQAPAPAQPIAYVETQGVSLTGSLSVANGRAAIANNSTVTAGDKTADVRLARGGSLKICTTTTVHLSRDIAPISQPSDTDSAGLMLALDRGALEASYSTGKYSDILLTPDLRILISGPGEADLKLRVNLQGDTCIDNHGPHAPYVTVSSLMDGGVYRVQPGQRVLFEHGSLGSVVDSEQEPCGCPDQGPTETATTPAPNVAGKPVGGPSSTPADTAFPTAVSEGLAAPPASPTTPIVPAGQAHAQVTALLSSDTPPTPPSGVASTPAAAASKPAPASPPPMPAQTSAPKRGLFGSIGHFFAKVFGAN